MRGPPTFPFRSGAQPRPSNEATGVPRAGIPCPYQGWNARGNLANMSAKDAIQMDNIFPGVQDVSLRKGSINWSTGYPANIKTLLAYSGAASNKLFASTDSNIYDATASGAVGAAVHSGITSGQWSYINFANSGGHFMPMVNGHDVYTLFDGAAWSTPAITGVTSSDLTYLTAHARRIWFIEKNSMNLWYLDVEAISGPASLFPVGALFKKGGYLVAIGAWTVDSGSGKDDLFVVVTSNGEIAVYGGTDPNSIVTWSLIGVYDVSQPLGTRPLLDYGGDLLYLSRTGLQPMTKITQTSPLVASDAISYQIDGAFLDAAANFNANSGWQMLTHKAQNMLIINVPVSNDVLSYQFVMNTISKTWCRFLNWNASTWAMSGEFIYFAGGTKVSRAWTGNSDAGAAIVGQVSQAYSPLSVRGQKQVTLVRPNIAFNAPVSFQLALDTDFKSFDGMTQLSYSPTGGGGIWDSGLWDTAKWNAPQVLDPKWTTVPGELGYLHSLRMQISSSQADVTWTSTDFVVRSAGIL